MFGKKFTSKNSKNKIFCGFRVFEYALSRKYRKLTVTLLNKINSHCQLLSLLENYKKATIVLFKYHFGFK